MKRTVLIVVVVLLLVPVMLYLVAPNFLVGLVIDLERKSSGLSKGSVVIGDHMVYYLEGGEGETILLVHGFGANKDIWNRLAKYLTPSFHVVAIDLPGFGESTKRQDAPYTIAAQVERLESMAKALSLEAFHVVGNSMGGSICGRFAIRFPDKVLTLGLFNTAGVLHCREKREIAQIMERGETPLLIETPEDFDAMIRLVYVKPPWFPGVVKKVLANQYAQNRDFNDKVLHQIMAEASSLEPDLPKIRTRTLILWGDTDRLIHVSCAEVLAKGLPSSTTVIMKDCGHAPMMERPEETAIHYKAFLAEG